MPASQVTEISPGRSAPRAERLIRGARMMMRRMITTLNLLGPLGLKGAFPSALMASAAILRLVSMAAMRACFFDQA